VDADFPFNFFGFEMDHFGRSLNGSLHFGLSLLGASVAEEEFGCDLLESAAFIREALGFVEDGLGSGADAVLD
jgi:hypothetical protein